MRIGDRDGNGLLHLQGFFNDEIHSLPGLGIVNRLNCSHSLEGYNACEKRWEIVNHSHVAEGPGSPPGLCVTAGKTGKPSAASSSLS